MYYKITYILNHAILICLFLILINFFSLYFIFFLFFSPFICFFIIVLVLKETKADIVRTYIYFVLCYMSIFFFLYNFVPFFVIRSIIFLLNDLNFYHYINFAFSFYFFIVLLSLNTLILIIKGALYIGSPLSWPFKPFYDILFSSIPTNIRTPI